MKSLGNVRRAFAPWTDPQAQPFIRVAGVTKKFGDYVAVDDLSLDVYEREFFSLLGPSGCGKSTLLRMLAGFEEPTSGDIFLDGQPLKGVPPHKRPVNMMFQSYALFPHMSVENNIAFGLRQEGMDKAAIAERVAQMLKLVKLEKFATRKPHQLSGGQRQRVALARSVAKRPKVLLLDEPLGALDKKLREETQFELMDLQQDLGLTFMIVTHDQDEAMTMSDRIAVMNAGVISQVGTPAEIYEAPVSRYVADFVGSVNLFEAKVSATAPGMIELSGADGFDMKVADTGTFTKDQTVWLAVRPEKIALTRERPQAENAVKGEAWEIAYMGDLTNYVVKLDSGKMVRATTVNRERAVDNPIGYDEPIWVSFSADGGAVLTQ